MSDDANAHSYVLLLPDRPEVIGTWLPPGLAPPAVLVHVTDDPDTAERWRTALLDGRVPATTNTR